MNGGPLSEGLELLHRGETVHPVGLAYDPDTLAKLKVKENRNGHIGVLLMFGHYVQAPSGCTKWRKACRCGP